MSASLTPDEAAEALRGLGTIPAWRADNPVSTSPNPFPEYDERPWCATGNVEPHGTRNVECAAGGYGDTPGEALAEMVECARRLAGQPPASYPSL